jgi:hypothetical protein
VIVGGGDLVCAVSRRGSARSEAEANTRLIAAAPDLRAAVCAVLRADQDRTQAKPDLWARALRACQVALDTAEGRQ